MTQLKTVSLRGGDFSVMYYQHGEGNHLVFFHSAGGLPAFTPELEELSKRFTVTAPLMPAFGSTGEEHLHEDVQKLVFWGWDLLDALKIDHPILVGHSFGGMLAAEMAATEPRRVKQLVLIAPAGLYVKEYPMFDIFAASPEALANAAFHDPNSEAAKAFLMPPTEPEALTDMIVARTKGLSMASRFLFPTGDRGLSERLYRIKASTLLLWGESDRLVPPQHAEVFKRLMTGATVTIKKIPAAGHVFFAEQPHSSVKAILDFCSR
jgi:pimeloyl-ACP methyl ester carboxylesterase